ncbi:MAG: shikimate kinase, partial [Desulfobacterales bacterium]
NLFLIGYRCSGKTSTGRTLAAKLGWTFVDSDRVITAEVGCSIADFIAAKGWAAFREKERNVIARLSVMDRQVVAAGGGAVTDDENVVCMRSSGKVIWLQASADVIRRRMQADAGTAVNRPPLTGQGSLEEIAVVLEVRKPLYVGAAHYRIDTDDLNTGEVVEKIIEIIESDLKIGQTGNPT